MMKDGKFFKITCIVSGVNIEKVYYTCIGMHTLYRDIMGLSCIVWYRSICE